MESSSKCYPIIKGTWNRDSKTINYKAHFKPQRSKYIEGDIRRGRIRNDILRGERFEFTNMVMNSYPAGSIARNLSSYSGPEFLIYWVSGPGSES
jgi:hypothetical protein